MGHDPSADPVRDHSPEAVNERIDHHTLGMLRRLEQALPAQIDTRLKELDGEWDVDSAFEVTAAGIALAGLALALLDRRFLVIPGLVAGFLAQHAISGWAAPELLFRRTGYRTRREIDRERTALRVLRGDFRGEVDHDADIALAVANRQVYAVE